ncbi:MAG: di-trans,poly-cis-decaprenylcistransferase [Zetaproteobacteria bacterium CG12_big_fil_rev_8_21_14_0_65_55_1124]|nr:MAG: di-trans,poly-cis-decaprenylcistransferase [Zetaproteobacteria bacterium CG1_02_55_237]PIS19895.1 MAG: di-trans,poly-cis-decaprenylcistransferase [Zetaproteobacteria bacterium CG08_land_8_20_14_0_20_55_17]PIW42557.1 MAG: di-trans,poly-cis-decaprenylcistransferase [Zetaproteobacteria bacterium CG12_big_fil_rev_8_21_14_0_65_55_1124]PIY51330.1 MAG: di-trans,poly-cis-decaprenylcistransferase [Zetaproteobacteria bacterium CG_4_10_14_0_8_um_filter_55_43]PIZ36647.1 MAG: di-trans,poly-cis-decap
MTNKPMLPRHVAVVMDGNGRWAKAKGLPRLEGHRRGAAKARQIVEWAADAGVKQISLFAFSTENWSRPKMEVRGLMSMLATLLPREIPAMQKQGVRVLALGDISALPDKAQRAIERACRETAGNTHIDLVLCLNYGGQQEMLAGAKKLCEWASSQDDPQAALASMDVATFRHFLWCDDLLPVDLLIRTGGEYRISNFLLWDAAYSELYFSQRYWPDFEQADFLAALDDYARRERRFGLISEQLPEQSGKKT